MPARSRRASAPSRPRSSSAARTASELLRALSRQRPHAAGAEGRARSAGAASSCPVGAARDQLRARPPRAAQRLRRALERGGPGGAAGRELRLGRPLRRARPRDRRAIVPAFGRRDRDDDTYYPVPWLLSSRGYGVLLDNDEASRSTSGAAAAGRPAPTRGELSLRVFAGPRPADALRRFTAATGRQPPPPAPWAYGPWFQTGQPNVTPLAEEAEIVRKFRDADAPVSAAETQMHFLPCGAQRGRGGLRAGAHAAVPRGGPRAPLLLQPAPVHRLPARVRRGGGRRGAPAGPDGRPSRSRPSSAAAARAGSRSSRSPSSTSPPAPRPRSTRGSCARRSTRARTGSWRTSASTPRPWRARPTARPGTASTTATRATTTARFGG